MKMRCIMAIFLISAFAGCSESAYRAEENGKEENTEEHKAPLLLKKTGTLSKSHVVK